MKRVKKRERNATEKEIKEMINVSLLTKAERTQVDEQISFIFVKKNVFMFCRVRAESSTPSRDMHLWSSQSPPGADCQGATSKHLQHTSQ